MRPIALVVFALVVAAPADAGPATYTGTLSVEFGDDLSPLRIDGSGMAFVDSGAIALTWNASPAFTPFTRPVGFTASAAPGTIYTVRQIHQAHQGGTGMLEPGGAPGGGFGGVLDAGFRYSRELGMAPLPNVFGQLSVHLPVGTSATATGTGVLFFTSFAVAASGAAWTTGRIVVSPGTPNGAGTQLTATGRGATIPATGSFSLSLVSPVSFTQTPLPVSLLPERRTVGIATLELAFTIPEPAPTLLLAFAVLALGVAGRRHERIPHALSARRRGRARSVRAAR